jgi:hypothetical protein
MRFLGGSFAAQFAVRLLRKFTCRSKFEKSVLMMSRLFVT